MVIVDFIVKAGAPVAIPRFASDTPGRYNFLIREQTRLAG